MLPIYYILISVEEKEKFLFLFLFVLFINSILTFHYYLYLFLALLRYPEKIVPGMLFRIFFFYNSFEVSCYKILIENQHFLNYYSIILVYYEIFIMFFPLVLDT